MKATLLLALTLTTFGTIRSLCAAEAPETKPPEVQPEPRVLLNTVRGPAQRFQHSTFTVENVERGAEIYVPSAAKETAAPVVFVFHGHGGTALNAARTFAIQRHWPEAIVVYMQGLNTPGQLTDPEGKKPGWQHAAGAEGDRDLKFFDAVLAKLKADYRVDARRIYATGHSNGGSFTYLLWAERGETFAAVAPSGSVAPRESISKLKAKPVLHIAGRTDPLVKFEWQERMMEVARKLDGCDATGSGWGKNATLYPSKGGTPMVAYVHEGGHEFPAAAPEWIVRFFQEHPAPEKKEAAQ
jgi:polyhydroxybutyrate depolymerase